MKIQEKHKWALGALIVGILLCHFTAFMSLFQYEGDQPHDFNCNRAATWCNFTSGGFDSTPYADCDSCCETPEAQTCNGQLIPTADQRDYNSAIAYCDQFTDCTSTLTALQCLPVYGIAGMWTSCQCQTAG